MNSARVDIFKARYDIARIGQNISIRHFHISHNTLCLAPPPPPDFA